MARKRMIDPEIWDNQRFGEMSLIARFLWIGMISHADDEGKGNAAPSQLKSKIFGFDTTVRVADVEKALAELSPKMSVTVYDVNGENYYRLDKWSLWQSIQKPKKSRIPDPPFDRGKGGDISQNEKIQYKYSTNTVQVQYEYNTEKEKEKEIYLSKRARAREKLPDWIEIDNDLTDEDVSVLSELIPIIEKSEYLRQWKFASKYLNNAEKIRSGYYDKYKREKSERSKKNQDADGYIKHTYTEGQLNAAFVNFGEDDQ